MSKSSIMVVLPEDVLAHIIRFCSLPTLTRLRATSVLVDLLCSSEMSIRHNNLLSHFFHDCEGFKRELQATGAVISGSAALSVCTSPLQLQPRDMDIYCPSQTFFHVLAYLTRVETYHIVRILPFSLDQSPYRGGVAAVVRLLHPDGRAIDVIQSLTTSPATPLFQFWGTLVMNFLTHAGAFVAYPAMLEFDRGLITPWRIGHSEEAMQRSTELAIAKYRTRGFAIGVHESDWAMDEIHPVAHSTAACPYTVRWIADRHSLYATFKPLHQRMGFLATPDVAFGVTNVWWRGGGLCERCAPLAPSRLGDVWTKRAIHVA